MPNPDPTRFTKEEIVSALHRLNHLLEEHGQTGEICLFGGAVMVLVFNARISTRDVDAIFQPAAIIRELAEEIAREMSLPTTWLNDGVKGFQSAQPMTTTSGLPQFSNLRLFRPTAEYLLAMKCLAARSTHDDASMDRLDILELVRYLHLTSEEAVFAIVEKFFPPERILPKTQFMIHEIIAELRKH